MAHHFEDASQYEQTLMVLTSGDPNVTGTAASFSHPVRQFVVDDPSNYAITLVSVDFRHPGSTTSVYVSCNLVGFSRVGSQMTNTLFRVEPRTAGRLHYVQNQSVVEWRPYGPATLTVADVQLTDSTGALIPVSPGDYTTLTVAIRRI